ncbi:response regulator transcription factor [Sphaerochaeta sp. UBA5836]|uniref:response regulator transcription factor n=1 Tax=Sphaerochaeta sp. UBA5836 TaxID=1947474 RepID=UPI0025DE7ECC|nr:AraC family transcriptional regulator [Sphaerochaeta sp. UBA5836]
MAVKLIIADDEPLVLVGLQSMLSWNELGIEMVGVARNGKQLEDAIAKERPDLVITDIKMPIKSGLEVLKECSKTYGRIPLFILLTSYEEFSFVKEALKFQAVDYLVKLELTEKSLRSSVTKALGMLEQLKAERGHTFPLLERSAMQSFCDKFFVRLFNGLIDSRQSFETQKQELQISFNERWYAVCYVHIQSKQEEAEVNLYYSTIGMLKETLSRYLTTYITSLDLHHLAITFCLTDEQAQHYRTIIRQVLEKTLQVIYNYFSVQLACCVGHTVQDPYHLNESFLSARQLMAGSSDGKTILIAERQSNENASFNLDPFKIRLTRAFEELDAEKLAEVIEDIAKELQDQNIPALQAVETASNILYMAITLLPDGQNLVQSAFAKESQGYRQIYSFGTTAQCSTYLRQLAGGLADQLQSRKQDYRAKVVANIQQYIKEHVTRKLNLGEVALLFGFSQNYLSSLFSKYSGCSFVEYTTNAKIAAAKEMMAKSDYKIYEVADTFDFESSFYFSKVFKKVEGISPRQYLQHLQRKRS